MRYQINDNWYYTDHYTGSLNSMPKERLEELEQVRIPHTVKELPMHYCNERDYQMVSGYVRELDIPGDWEGRCVTLTLEGAAHQAEVYCNGTSLGVHGCGYTAFETDLSEHLRYGHRNRIVVRLDSRESLNIPPFGHVVDYMTYGGLYRPVYLEVREKTHFTDIFVMPDDRKHLEVQVQAAGAQDCQIRACVLDGGGEAVARMEEQKFQDHFHMHVPRAKLWDTEHPNLYTLRLELLRYGKVLDEREVRFGFRTIGMKPDGCYLNGSRVQIRGLDRHQSWPYMGYAAPERAQRLDADILRYELGCNGVRTSHYPQSQAFVDRCDEIGLLVFTEIPGWQHIGDDAWKDQAVQNVEEMVLQYRNHPSIFLWGVRINESQDDDSFYTRTVEAAHRLDPTRPTGGVRYLRKSSLLEDVYTYNDFVHEGNNRGCIPKAEATPDPEKAYFITEYNGHMFPTKAFDDEGHRREHALRHACVLDAALSHGDIGGTFGWCMFDYNTHRDFGSGDRICYHGVLDMFRNPKPAAAVYASQQEERPVLEVASAMNIGDHPAGRLGEVAVFTNGDKVRLYRNGEPAGEYGPSLRYSHLPHPPVLIRDSMVPESQVGGEGNVHMAKGAQKDRLGAVKRWFAKLMEKPAGGTKAETQYMGSWGEETASWTFEAVKDGKPMASVTVEPVERIHLEALCDTDMLVDGDTWDMATIRLRAADQNGNTAVYANDVLHFAAEGAVQVEGPDFMALEGGMGGCYVRTTGMEGEGKLHIYRGREEEIVLTFRVQAKQPAVPSIE